MSERKQKQTENTELDVEETSFMLEPSQVEVGAGYTVQVKYNELEKPIVNVKTYGNVDLVKIRKDIERIFPNAQIRQLNQPTTITVAKVNIRKLRKKKRRA